MKLGRLSIDCFGGWGLHFWRRPASFPVAHRIVWVLVVGPFTISWARRAGS